MLTFHKVDNKIIAELTEETFIITATQDAPDIMGDAGVKMCNRGIRIFFVESLSDALHRL
jgi:hypothetical protein